MSYSLLMLSLINSCVLNLTECQNYTKIISKPDKEAYDTISFFFRIVVYSVQINVGY